VTFQFLSSAIYSTVLASSTLLTYCRHLSVEISCRQIIRRLPSVAPKMLPTLLKNTATRVVTSPAVRRFCLCRGLDSSKAGVLSNNAPFYCLRTVASVSCRNVSCSLVWTGAAPLCGLCSVSTATSRTHTTFFTTGRNVRHYW
jgi:hypothetical protein